MNNYAPIALFVYKRLDLTRQTIEALQKNNLARFSKLYIFSDAARSQKDEKQVAQVREYISGIKGFAEVTVIAAEKNKGCAKSVIAGVSWVFRECGKIIVVEDDLVTTPNFLDYMNAALDFYKDKNAFAIEGWSIALKFPDNYNYDVYFIPRGGSWGWATWKDRWQTVDWEVSDYETFRNNKAARKKFNEGGDDLSRMLDLQMAGKIDSWAIRFAYALYKSGKLNVVPRISKVKNIGFESDATHTLNDPNYPLVLDDGSKTEFEFCDVQINNNLVEQFRCYFSLPYRVKNRLYNYWRSLSSRRNGG